jgi:hypothetical protein
LQNRKIERNIMDGENEILSAYPEELHEAIKELWDRELI